MKIKLLPILLALFLGSFAVSSLAVSAGTKFDQAATDGDLIFNTNPKDACLEKATLGCGVCFEKKKDKPCSNYRKALTNYEYCLQKKQEDADWTDPHKWGSVDCSGERNNACEKRKAISGLGNDVCPYGKVKK